MSQYEELRERCCQVIIGRVPERVVDDILAEVFRTLETVTPEMLAPFAKVTKKMPRPTWLAMLRASPLAPPKDNGNE